MKLLIAFVALVGLAAAVDDGQYRPERLYRLGIDDGRYKPDYSGLYQGEKPRPKGRFRTSPSVFSFGSGNSVAAAKRPISSPSAFGAFNGASAASSRVAPVSGNSASVSKSAVAANAAFLGLNQLLPPRQTSKSSAAAVRNNFNAPSSFGQQSNFGRASSFGQQSRFGQQNVFAASNQVPRTTNEIKILRQTNDHDENGYQFAYNTANNINAQEQGRVFYKGSDSEIMRASGFYQYIGDDGVPYRVDYTADENGFVPRGRHIPTAPPVPRLIQKSLDYIARTQG